MTLDAALVAKVRRRRMLSWLAPMKPMVIRAKTLLKAWVLR